MCLHLITMIFTGTFCESYYEDIKSYVSNFYVGMVVEKNGRWHIAIQNVAKIISVVEALYAILTVCLGLTM